jgi:hypothetical protein
MYSFLSLDQFNSGTSVINPVGLLVSAYLIMILLAFLSQYTNLVKSTLSYTYYDI